MARIENLRLADAGKRRNATFTVRGTIIWEDTEASRNAMEIRLSFFGEDRGDDDRLENHVAVAVKGQSDRIDEGGGAWTITAVNPTRTDFVLVRENSNGWAWQRPFNEDRPGRDEVYARAVVRDTVDGTNLSEWARSNTVTGRY